MSFMVNETLEDNARIDRDRAYATCLEFLQRASAGANVTLTLLRRKVGNIHWNCSFATVHLEIVNCIRSKQ